MFKLIAFAVVALAALSTVNGAPIFRRQTPPATWDANILEPYDQYHDRYLAIGCQNHHNTTFFDDCCHPLKKNETVQDNRKPYCAPGYNSSSTLSGPTPSNLVSTPASSPAPEPSPAPNSGDVDVDCDDNGSNDNGNSDDNGNDDGDDDGDCGDDEPSSSPAYEPSSTPSVPTPTYNPEPTSTPTPTPAPEPSPSSSTDDGSSPTPTPTDDSSPTPSPTQNSGSGSETHTGGDLTWFTQNGVAGACGQVHSDSDFIAALDVNVYGDTSVQSPYCGKTIRITWQGNSVDVVVADACPTCDNASSVDLSEAAFQALAPLSTGLLTDATWTLLD